MVLGVTGVRDRLWLLAHDERDTHPYVDPRALSIGLVAAALIDLMLSPLIEICDGRIYPLAGDHEPYSDPVAASILAAVRDDAAPRLAAVLRGARSAASGNEFNPYVGVYHRTRAALVANGTLLEQRRTLRPDRYWLADPGCAVWHRKQLHTRLIHQHRRTDLATESLYALVWALNIHRAFVLPYSPGEADAILRDIIDRIPARAEPGTPPTVVPHLARSVRRAVGDLATAAF